MKRISNNYGKLLLLFIKGECREIVDTWLKEQEYYMSDDGKLFAAIVKDAADDTFSVALHGRDESGIFQMFTFALDLPTIGKARNRAVAMMEEHKDDKIPAKTQTNGIELFSKVLNPKQVSPLFQMLQSDEFYSPAKAVIREFAKYFIDCDNNFVDQFQSLNGFDSRVWEFFLLCFLREEGFTINKDYAVPDFFVEKFEEKVAIEAVIVNRIDKHYKNTIPDANIDEMFAKLDNDIPLKFGSSLFSKLKHTYENKKYWEIDHVKGCPFLIAIEDFHEDMSMCWSFPGIISILYGIEQNVQEIDGEIVLTTSNGKMFIKANGIDIVPLFQDQNFENISAVLFSATGTLSKFNRMGKQAGLGSPNIHLLNTTCCYNHDTNALFPNFEARIVDEDCNERWGDGVAIFHNPLAKLPLDPSLFPNVAHHFYESGQLHSSIPEHHVMSSFTWNLKGNDLSFKSFVMKMKGRFDKVTSQWNMTDKHE